MHSQLSAPIGVADNGETLGPLADKASHCFEGAKDGGEFLSGEPD